VWLLSGALSSRAEDGAGRVTRRGRRADAGALEHHQGALPGRLPLQAGLRRLAGARPRLPIGTCWPSWPSGDGWQVLFRLVPHCAEGEALCGASNRAPGPHGAIRCVHLCPMCSHVARLAAAARTRGSARGAGPLAGRRLARGADARGPPRGAQFVGPVFLNLLLNVVATGQSSARGYAYALLMLFGLELGTLADNQHFQRTMRAGAPPTPLTPAARLQNPGGRPHMQLQARATRCAVLPAQPAGGLVRGPACASARGRARVRLPAGSRRQASSRPYPSLGRLSGECGRLPRAGYQLRALLVHAVFRKVLYLAPTARGEFSSGRVFNLVTSDAETLQARPRPRPPRRARPELCVLAEVDMHVQKLQNSVLGRSVRPVQALPADATVTSLSRAGQQMRAGSAPAEGAWRAGWSGCSCNACAPHARCAVLPATRACDGRGVAV